MNALPDFLFVAAIALGIVVWLRQYAWSHSPDAGRQRSPLWLGFSTSAAALLFIAAGLVGFNLDRHARSVSGRPWEDGVIWWEVAAGLVLLPIALVAVRRGFRDLQNEVAAREGARRPR